MVPSGNNWKWPVMPYEIFYTADKTVQETEATLRCQQPWTFWLSGSVNDLKWVQNVCFSEHSEQT